MTTPPASAAPSSLAIVNARVWTGDARRPWADAVLVRGATLAAVGSSAEVKKRLAPGTRVIDAGRMTVVPGALGGHARGGEALGRAGATIAAAGEPADLAILDRDLVRVTPDAVGEARVVLVVLGGQVIYADADLTGATS